MQKKVAFIQSNYIPWKGYFDFINRVDEFILYDDVQYTKSDWRNRNLIKTSKGIQWLTIPVHGRIDQLIYETEVVNGLWSKKHWKSLLTNYSKARFFKDYANLFYNLYRECKSIKQLSHINYKFIKAICDIMNIKTKLSWSMDFAKYTHGIADKNERLIALCKATGGTNFILGPAAKNYINENLFASNNIELHYMDYSRYTPYNQLHGEFVHKVSVLDLLFNEGPRAIDFIRENG